MSSPVDTDQTDQTGQDVRRMVFMENMVLFTRELRGAGIPIALGQVQDFLRALELVRIDKREEVFHAARSMLIGQQDHLLVFETVFDRFFTPEVAPGPLPQTMPRAPRHPVREKPFDITTYMAYKARLFDEEIDVGDKAMTFSSVEALRSKDFSRLTPEELDTLRRLLHEMTWAFSQRRTPRRVLARQGDYLHLRRILRASARTGGVPIHLSWQTRTLKRRPIVLIADISGSMERYARVILLLFHTVARQFQRSSPGVECFVFGTRLTRITTQLRQKDVDLAIDQAAREVIDWSGGTRIGDSLHTFNVRWGRRVLGRGAIVIVVSDGWERGDCQVLAHEMRHVQHHCHRLIWLNPLAGQPAYQARVEGMQAAMPFIDDFLPVHNLESLLVLNKLLASLSRHVAR